MNIHAAGGHRLVALLNGRQRQKEDKKVPKIKRRVIYWAACWAEEGDLLGRMLRFATVAAQIRRLQELCPVGHTWFVCLSSHSHVSFQVNELQDFCSGALLQGTGIAGVQYRSPSLSVVMLLLNPTPIRFLFSTPLVPFARTISGQVVFHGEACVPGFASTIVAAKKRLSGTVLYLGRV